MSQSINQEKYHQKKKDFYDKYVTKLLTGSNQDLVKLEERKS